MLPGTELTMFQQGVHKLSRALVVSKSGRLGRRRIVISVTDLISSFVMISSVDDNERPVNEKKRNNACQQSMPHYERYSLCNAIQLSTSIFPLLDISAPALLYFDLAYNLLMKRRAAKRRKRWGRMYLEKM